MRCVRFYLGLFLILAGSAALGFVYKVKEGDTLSTVVRHQLTGPVYGINGSLKRVVELNPQIENINLIYPGTEIILPDEFEARVPASAPAPVPTPSQASIAPPAPPADSAVAKSHSYGVIQLAPRFSFTRINATDSSTGGTSTFLSDLNYGLALQWSQVWNENWTTFLYLDDTETFLHGPSIETLGNPSQNPSDFGLGVRRSLTSRLALSLSAGCEQQLFSRATSTTNIAFDSVAIPKLPLALDWDLVRRDVFTLSVGIDASFYLPVTASDYSISPNVGYGGKIYLTEDLGLSHKLTGGVWYQQQNQTTSIATQSTTDLGFMLGYAWELDHEK